ncbi:hypothetical protein ITJ60_01665 [Curtobacterium sp. VKM Ac-2884]|nr:hypothetical protein [Curtobacterium sp. VKM Ac-2884]
MTAPGQGSRPPPGWSVRHPGREARLAFCNAECVGRVVGPTAWRPPSLESPPTTDDRRTTGATVPNPTAPKTAIVTDDAPKPAGPYSQGIVANGFIYTAGFGPQDPATGAIADDVAGQTAQVLANVAAVLAEHGATLDDVVKSTVHLEHSDRDFPAFNEEYAKHFSQPYPVRTTVQSHLANILVEIDVVAVLPSAS